MNNEKINITFNHWEYTCGDGCCYEDGIAMSINGEEVCHNVSYNEQEVARSILKYLGIDNYSIDEIYDGTAWNPLHDLKTLISAVEASDRDDYARDLAEQLKEKYK